jgi:hypothetical protein
MNTNRITLSLTDEDLERLMRIGQRAGIKAAGGRKQGATNISETVRRLAVYAEPFVMGGGKLPKEEA